MDLISSTDRDNKPLINLVGNLGINRNLKTLGNGLLRVLSLVDVFLCLHNEKTFRYLLIIEACVTPLVNVVSVTCYGRPCVQVSCHVRLMLDDSYSMYWSFDLSLASVYSCFLLSPCKGVYHCSSYCWLSTT